MSIKCKIFGLAVAVATLPSCGGKTPPSNSTDWVEDEEQEVPLEDDSKESTDEEEEKLALNEESAPAMDGVFNDFLFAYLHSHTLRSERTAKPLLLKHTSLPADTLEDFDPEFEFAFLSGDYFTTLYGNVSQMLAEDDEEAEEDSVVNLQRINLNDGTIRNFQFLREQGRWQLNAIREATFEDDELGDFLSFYAHFCTDSIFQAQSVADPLHIVIQGTEDEEETIDGIIDADQWQAFCPEVPSGIISNIRKGQNYGPNRIVMCKNGLSSGLQEVFTFTRERGIWRLTRYEN